MQIHRYLSIYVRCCLIYSALFLLHGRERMISAMAYTTFFFSSSSCFRVGWGKRDACLSVDMCRERDAHERERERELSKMKRTSLENDLRVCLICLCIIVVLLWLFDMIWLFASLSFKENKDFLLDWLVLLLARFCRGSYLIGTPDGLK